MLSPAPILLRTGQRPGLQRPARPDLPALLALGRPASQLPGAMAALHGLCAAGHWLAAALAVRAASGADARARPAELQALRHAVAREHLRRIALDWPQLLPAGQGPTLTPSSSPTPTLTSTSTSTSTSAPTPTLLACPLWDTTLPESTQLHALPAWLQAQWLDGEPPEALAACISADLQAGAAGQPHGALLAWAQGHTGPLASLLARLLPAAAALAVPARHLRPGEAGPVQASSRPAVLAPDTGPWSRARLPAQARAHNAAMRLAARLHDLLQLALPGGAGWLLAQAQAPAPGQGEAWVEVGRGLLHYRVQLGGAQGERQASPVLAALQLRTPTDVNCDPAGPLAEALAAASCTDQAHLLAGAFDLCEPVAVLPPPLGADAPGQPEAADA